MPYISSTFHDDVDGIEMSIERGQKREITPSSQGQVSSTQAERMIQDEKEISHLESAIAM